MHVTNNYWWVDNLHLYIFDHIFFLTLRGKGALDLHRRRLTSRPVYCWAVYRELHGLQMHLIDIMVRFSATKGYSPHPHILQAQHEALASEHVCEREVGGGGGKELGACGGAPNRPTAARLWGGQLGARRRARGHAEANKGGAREQGG